MTRTFQLSPYCKKSDRLYYGSELFQIRTLQELLIAERDLRETTQYDELLHQRINGLEKSIAIDTDEKLKIQLSQTYQQLEELRAQFFKHEHALYKAEAMLDGIVKDDYENLRRDQQWYMREELIKDCAARGGCCSRGCGCCADRPTAKGQKGRGHCTSNCVCCVGFQGFEFPEEQKDEIKMDFRDMVQNKESKAYLIRMANCFVAPQKPRVIEPPAASGKSKWKKIFR